MKIKFKSKKIITEYLKTDNNSDDVNMLNEENILESDI